MQTWQSVIFLDCFLTGSLQTFLMYTCDEKNQSDFMKEQAYDMLLEHTLVKSVFICLICVECRSVPYYLYIVTFIKLKYRFLIVNNNFGSIWIFEILVQLPI